MAKHEHLTSGEEKALETFVKQLIDELEPEIADVRIFGSKARGDAGPESDLDILVLVRDAAYTLKHRILWMAAEISLEYDLLLSPRIIPPDAWGEMAEAETLFFREIQSDSVPLLSAA
jgi:predicted nucleotidyltransferase